MNSRNWSSRVGAIAERCAVGSKVLARRLKKGIAVDALLAHAGTNPLVESLEQRTFLNADTLGREFWVAFQQNFSNASPSLTLFMTGPTATTGVVEIPGLSFSTNFSVTPGQVTSVSVPSNAFANSNDGIQNVGIRVSALEEIALYGLNRVPFTTDAFVAYPTDILATEYLAQTYIALGSDQSASQFSVVATQDNTTLTVRPTSNTDIRTAGVDFNITLQRGQVYTLASVAAGSDLTGSSIVSNRPVAVFSGNSSTQVPRGTSFVDHIVEQVPPVATWGRNFVTVPLAQRTGGDVFRVLASEANTQVSLDGVVVATLNRGQFFETRQSVARTITATRPVLLSQFSTGRTFDNTTGDPFMAIVPPIEQLLASYTVTTPSTGFATHWINVFTPSQAIGSVLLNGQVVPPAQFTAIGTSGFSYARLSVPAGTHTVSSSSPLGAMVYGFNQDDSYGYTGGASLVPIRDVASVTLTPPTQTLYVGQPGTVTATVLDLNGVPVFGARVDFTVSGANTRSGFAFTRFNGQAEFTYTATNAGEDIVLGAVASVTGQASVNQGAQPNLTIANNSSQQSGTWGQAALAAWRVTNQSGITNTSWTDRIYLSTDGTLDGADRLVGQRPNTGSLGAGASYDASVAFSIPNDFNAGRYFLLVSTNADQAQFESNYNDNVLALSFDLLAPNLVPGNLTLSQPLVFGQEIALAWRVNNTGSFETTRAFNDTVRLSTSPTFSTSATVLTTRRRTSNVSSGDGYDASVSASLPLNTSLPSGQYYFYLQTDSSGEIRESDESLNVIRVGPFQVDLPPLPDLIVESISAPSAALSGDRVSVTWTIRNQGNGAATGTWTDEVRLSSDQTIGSDLFMGSFAFAGTIPAGGTITRTQLFTLPDVFSGAQRFVVTTDRNNELFEFDRENNNAAIDDQVMQVTLRPFPNLTVSQALAPTSAFSGQQVVVQWAVTNIGSGPTSSANWIDHVYLSLNTTFDASDINLGTQSNASYLGSGESYASSLLVTLPEGISGSYYFIVVADSNNQVFELNGESDNSRASNATDVTLTPPPDLRVTSVGAPTAAFSGQTISLTWTVANNGTGSTRAVAWTDYVYVSFDDDQLGPTDRLLGSLRRNGELASGQNYSVSGFNVTLPIGVAGQAFFIIRTDVFNEVFEAGFEGNNITVRGTSTQVNLTPPPDLEVVDVAAPATALAGRAITFSYTVANNGATATPNSSWTDAYYLSADAVLDGSDFALGSRSRSGVLDAGEEETITRTFTLPTNVVGSRYVLVVTDSGNQVFEINKVNNRAASAVLQVGIDAPDLRVVFAGLSADNPSNVFESGSSLLLDWSILNKGAGSTYGGSWTDRVVISADSVFGNGDDVTLLSLSNVSQLAQSASYDRSAVRVNLPFSLASGSYNIFVQVDSGNAVFEGGAESNNVSAGIPIQLERTTADLQVSAFVVPNTLSTTLPAVLSWTIVNRGAGTNVDAWFDHVYLSRDQNIGSDDVLLFSQQRTGSLAANASYSATRSVNLPLDLQGQYFFIVHTDATNRVIETPFEDNNTRIGSTSTGGGPGGDPIDITPGPVADLIVTNVDAPASAFSGRSFSVTWTVRNNGASTTLSWIDAVYLSIDQVFDRGSDVYIGFAERFAGLPAGDEYSQSGSFTLPQGLAGRFYVFIATDNNNRVPERANELNNSNFDVIAMDIALTPPADLVIGSIDVPNNGSPGTNATITYTVRNDGSNPAVGTWTDSLYLSADDQWDLGDELFERVTVQGPLNAGTTYTRSVTAPLPGVLPGNYRVIIRSDIRNNIAESNEGNNLSASINSVSLDAQELTLGVASEGELRAARAVYYKVVVPAGATLVIDFDSLASSGFTELFASFGTMPSRTRSDFSSIQPFRQDQRVVISDTEAGTYYILAYGTQVPGGTSAFRVTARTVEFSVFDTSYGQGGTSGNRTIEVNGAKFDRSVQVELVNSEGSVIANAVDRFFESSTRMYATFNLRTVAPGTYSVRLSKAGSAPVTVASGLEVVRTLNVPEVVPYLDAPSAVRRGVDYSFVVNWANDTLNDVPAPLLVVGNTVPIGLTRGVYDLGVRHSFVAVASNGGGPKGILRPGQTGSRTFYSQSDLSAGRHTTFVDRLVSDLSRPFDWESVRDDALDTTLSDAAYAAAFNAMRTRVGSTWGDYLAMLSRNATLIPESLGDASDVNALLGVELLKARASLGNSIVGSVQPASDTQVLGGGRIRARNAVTLSASFATVFNDGSFFLPGLSAGRYEVGHLTEFTNTLSAVTVRAGDQSSVTLSMVGSSSLSGRVVNSTGGVVSNATITVLGLEDLSGNRAARTTQVSAEGTFRLTGLRPGDNLVVIEGSGFARLTAATTLLEGRSSRATYSLSSESRALVSISVLGGGQAPADVRLSATRVDPVSPLEAAASVFGGRVVNGAGELAGLPAGNYSLLVSASGFITQSATFSVTAGQVVNLASIALPRELRVRGTATSSLAGINAEGKTVGAYRDGQDTPVASAVVSQGVFDIRELPAGAYTLRFVDLIEGVSSDLQVSGASGATIDGLAIAIRIGGTARGTVRSASGTPLVGVTVTARVRGEAVGNTITNASGAFRIPGLATGQVELSLDSQSPTARAFVNIVAINGEEYIADLTAPVIGSIQGSVLRSGGVASRVLVELVQEGRTVSSVRTASDGSYSFQMLSAGTYFVVATGLGGRATSDLINYAGGQTTLDLTFIGQPLSITVADGAARVANALAQLEVVSATGNVVIGEAMTDSQGVARFDAVAPGTYTLRVSTTTGRGVLRTIAMQTSPASLFVNTGSVGAISGTITHGTNPIRGAVVLITPRFANGNKFTTVTDADGRFAINAVDSGSYWLTAISEGLATSVVAIEIADTELVRRIALSDAATATASGRVVGSSGEGLVGVNVSIVDAQGAVVGLGSTDAQGGFVVTGMPSGASSIRIESEGFVLQELPAALMSGEVLNVGSVGLAAIAFAGGQQPPSILPWQPDTPDVGPDAIFGWISDLFAGFDNDLATVPDLPPDCPGCRGAQQQAQIRRNAADQAFQYADETREHLIDAAGAAAWELGEYVVTATWRLVQILPVLRFFKVGGKLYKAIDKISPLCAQTIQDSAVDVIDGVSDLLESSKNPGKARSFTDFYTAVLQIPAKLNDVRGLAVNVARVAMACITKVRGDGTAFNQLGEAERVFGYIDQIFELGETLDDLYPSELIEASGALGGALANFNGARDYYESTKENFERALDNYRRCLADQDRCCTDPSCDDDPPPDEPNDDDEDIERPAAVDPNDILGPEGFGPEKWVSAFQPLAYTIRFENDPDFATAPAQMVSITSILDEDVDARTFRLGDFGFGELRVSVPENRAFFTTRVDLRATRGIFVDVVAGVDVATRRIFWTFTSIDPATGEQPANPLLGFLPPNLTAPEGDGFVNFTVRPLRTAVTGARVDAEARIVFDVQAPIDTPPIFNTLDADRPVSTVEALPAVVASAFDVRWGGSDDSSGSGLATYNVYVSEDGGPFTLWLGATTATTARFAGEFGKQYRFFSTANDNAGNVESAPQFADASTQTPGRPTVSEFILNDGNAQRSRITRFVISFDQSVELMPGAFELTRRGTALTGVNLEITDAAGDGRTFIVTFTGQGVSAGSLPEGIFDLRIVKEKVKGGFGQAMAEDRIYTFHRLIGDSDGDRDVDTRDFTRFQRAFGSRLGQTNYVPWLDIDGDGDIDATDGLAIRSNIGVRLKY